MPSLSYIATANAVSYVGGKSVFVDVNANTWQVDVKQIENSITKKQKQLFRFISMEAFQILNQ